MERSDSFGFLDAEPFLLEVAEEPFHDRVVPTRALSRNRLSEPSAALGVPPEGVAVLKSLVEWRNGGDGRQCELARVTSDGTPTVILVLWSERGSVQWMCPWSFPFTSVRPA